MHTITPYSHLVLNQIQLKKKTIIENGVQNVSSNTLLIQPPRRNNLSLLNNNCLNNSSTYISAYSTNKQDLSDYSFSSYRPNINKSNEKQKAKFKKINTNCFNRSLLLKHSVIDCSRQEKSKDMYKDIFRNRSKLFDNKKRSHTIDNILNIKYAENYEQLNILRLKEKAKGDKFIYKSFSNCNLNPLSNSQKKLHRIKNSLSFVKCIFDYSYPEVYKAKNQCLSKERKSKLKIKVKPMIDELKQEMKQFEKKKYNFLKPAINIKQIKV
jgi:hypothetical protein